MTSRGHQLGQPALEMLECGDMLEATIGERRAVSSLGRGLPARRSEHGAGADVALAMSAAAGREWVAHRVRCRAGRR